MAGALVLGRQFHVVLVKVVQIMVGRGGGAEGLALEGDFRKGEDVGGAVHDAVAVVVERVGEVLLLLKNSDPMCQRAAQQARLMPK